MKNKDYPLQNHDYRKIILWYVILFILLIIIFYFLYHSVKGNYPLLIVIIIPLSFCLLSLLQLFRIYKGTIKEVNTSKESIEVKLFLKKPIIIFYKDFIGIKKQDAFYVIKTNKHFRIRKSYGEGEIYSFLLNPKIFSIINENYNKYIKNRKN